MVSGFSNCDIRVRLRTNLCLDCFNDGVVTRSANKSQLQMREQLKSLATMSTPSTDMSFDVVVHAADDTARNLVFWTYRYSQVHFIHYSLTYADANHCGAIMRYALRCALRCAMV